MKTKKMAITVEWDADNTMIMSSNVENVSISQTCNAFTQFVAREIIDNADGDLDILDENIEIHVNNTVQNFHDIVLDIMNDNNKVSVN